MRLKWRIAAVCAAFVLAGSLLAACSSGDDVPPVVAGTPDSASVPAASSAPSQPGAAPAASLKDTEVAYKGVVLAPDGDMAPVLEALGEPLEYSEMISCMFESGMDKTYVYDGVTIYTYPTKTQELILLIDVATPDAQTSRGVKVGDSLDAALLQYNNEIAPETTTRYVATFGDIIFSIVAEDGLVKSITYELDKAPIS